MSAQRTAKVCACGEHGWIPLTRGRVALIDPEFSPALSMWLWFAHFDGTNWYARRTEHYHAADGSLRNISVPMHAAVRPTPAGYVLDHIDGDTLNNRLSNLRITDKAGNARNRRKRAGSASPFRGVTWASPKWRASITLQGREKYIGRFDTQEDAARAYDAAARILHGEFARLNFPDEYRLDKREQMDRYIEARKDYEQGLRDLDLSLTSLAAEHEDGRVGDVKIERAA